MRSNRLISVVIPAYNRAPYIAEAIRSVLEQEDNKWSLEVIVVDDGSTDNTAEVVATFGNKVTYIPIPHSGKPAVARNVGLKHAKGELIAFQDSDDMWVADKLARQVNVFDDEDVVLSYGNGEVIKTDGKKTGQLVVDSEKLKSGYIFTDLVKENFISTLTVMVRRSTIEEVGGFCEDDELRAIEDYDLWLRIAGRRLGKIQAVDHTLAYYRRHDQNISAGSASLALSRIINTYNHLWLEELSEKYRLALEEATTNAQESWGVTKNEDEPTTRPTISVVMGVYNGGEFLKPAIQSILDQTYRNFEFILVDDGSKDDSAQVIRDFNDPRIRLIQQTNHGLVYSLNKGVRLARGEFIARMDADDISLPSRFEKELQFLMSSPKRGLVGAYFTYIDEKTSSPSITLVTPTSHIDLHRMLYIVNPFAHGSTMYRKEAILQAGMYRDTHGHTEDYDLWRRIVKEWELGQIPEVLYLYRINPNSISHQNNESQNKFARQIAQELWDEESFPYKGPRAVVNDLYKMLPDIPIVFREAVRGQYAEQQVGFAIELLNRRHFNTGLRTALAAIKLDRSLTKRLWRPVTSGFVKRIKKQLVRS